MGGDIECANQVMVEKENPHCRLEMKKENSELSIARICIFDRYEKYRAYQIDLETFLHRVISEQNSFNKKNLIQYISSFR